LTTSGGGLGATAIKVASAKVSMTFAQAIIRGILCNILVVLAVWMAIGAQDFISKIWACWFPIMLFVLSGFEHSIANMYFIPVGILAKANAQFAEVSGLAAEKLAAVNWGTFLTNNLIPVTIGNIIGGAVVVSWVYWYVYKGLQEGRKSCCLDSLIIWYNIIKSAYGAFDYLAGTVGI
jgi:formate/nitrite transporter